MAAARASRGAKLGTVRFANDKGMLDPGGVLELRKHVLHVESGPWFDVSGDDSSDSDGEDRKRVWPMGLW